METNITNDSFEIVEYPGSMPVIGDYAPYSYMSLSSEDDDVKVFFKIFRESFMKGIYYNLEGNLTYAYYLQFFLEKKMNNSYNYYYCEELINRIFIVYPNVRNVVSSSLLFMRKFLNLDEFEVIINDSKDSVLRLTLANRFRAKLRLSLQQYKLLGQVFFNNNSFLNVEPCIIDTINIFFKVFDKLNNVYKSNNTTFQKIINKYVQKAYSEFKLKAKLSMSDNSYLNIYIVTFMMNIFNYCENAVRKYRSINRLTKINWDLFANVYEKEIIPDVFHKIDNVLPDLLSELPQLSDQVERYFNEKNQFRWKTSLKNIAENTNPVLNPRLFIERVNRLFNQHDNPEKFVNIYFEGIEFLEGADKTFILEQYLIYIYNAVVHKNLVFKELPKKIQKKCFANDNQKSDFNSIVLNLKTTQDLQTALDDLTNLLTVKRKIIELDSTSILQAQEKHIDTVVILNEYLRDDEGPVNTIELTPEIKPVAEPTIEHKFLAELNLSKTQIELLELFSRNKFVILQSEMDTFVKSRKLFKNGLVDSVNELCFDVLDDNLIEEEDDKFVVNENYYKKIVE